MLLRMGNVDELTERERKPAEVLREHEAHPPGYKMTPDELMAIIRKMPGLPEGWSSADYIRELRGPLPEDDPEFPNFIRDRR